MVTINRMNSRKTTSDGGSLKLCKQADKSDTELSERERSGSLRGRKKSERIGRSKNNSIGGGDREGSKSSTVTLRRQVRNTQSLVSPSGTVVHK